MLCECVDNDYECVFAGLETVGVYCTHFLGGERALCQADHLGHKSKVDTPLPAPPIQTHKHLHYPLPEHKHTHTHYSK